MEEKGDDPFGSDGFLGRAENHPLSKPMVYHDQERIKAGGDREVHDEITGALLEGMRCRGPYGRKRRYSGVHVGLVLLTRGTSFNVLAGISSQAGPPELSCNKLPGLEKAGMSSGFMVMALLEDGEAEGIICRDIDATLVGQDAGFDSPVSEVGAEREGNVLMHGLECLQDKGVTGRSRLYTMREGSVNKVDKKGRWK